MHRNVRLKFWFYEHYWWILVLAISVAVVTLLVLNEPVATIATVVVPLLSVAYFLQKQKLEELRLFREIFKECNLRYDGMNEALATISGKAASELTSEDRAKVIDYLRAYP